MAVDFSFIIPHYNTPELLVRCLKSIPVREDIQVIVVDDCSPGADTYKSRFDEFTRPYLEWYSTPKGGCPGRARNIGLDHAIGKWVLFIDADDYYTDKLESVLAKYVDSDYDVIHFKEDSIDDTTHMQSDRHINRNNSIDAYFAGSVNARVAALWQTTIVAQIISRKYIEDNHIRFDEVSVAEDVMYVARLSCLTNKICISDEVLYMVTTRPNGFHSSYQWELNKFVDYQRILIQYARFVRKYGVDLVKPCVPKMILDAYKQYGRKGCIKIIQIAIQEHALFYGLGDYLKRKICAK